MRTMTNNTLDLPEYKKILHAWDICYQLDNYAFTYQFGFIDTESDEWPIVLNKYENGEYHHVDDFENLDDLILELEERLSPKAKYDIDQLVYVRHDHEIYCFKIEEIKFDYDGIWYVYHVDDDQTEKYREDRVYGTKEDLIRSEIAYWSGHLITVSSGFNLKSPVLIKDVQCTPNGDYHISDQ